LPAVTVNPKDKKADKSGEAPPWFKIESDHWSYLAKAIDGQYPNCPQVVPADTVGWTCIRLSPEAMEMMQQAVPLLPWADTFCQTVVLEVTPDGFLLCVGAKRTRRTPPYRFRKFRSPASLSRWRSTARIC